MGLTITPSVPSTSAGLAAIITDETGSGALVFGTSPTLTTPVIASIVNTGTQTVPTVTGTLVQYIENTIASNATWAPTGDARINWYQITAQAVAVTTISAPSGTPSNHNELYIRVKDNATARAISGFDAIYRFSADLPAPTTTIISKTMYLRFLYNSADTKWDFVGMINNF